MSKLIFAGYATASVLGRTTGGLGPSTMRNRGLPRSLIGDYMWRIAQRSLQKGWPHPKIFVFDEDFFEEIRAKKFDSVQKKIPQVRDLFSYRFLIIPAITQRYRSSGSMHIGIEVLDLKYHTVSYYDSDLFQTPPKEVVYYHRIVR
jgi:hypothetical protein